MILHLKIFSNLIQIVSNHKITVFIIIVLYYVYLPGWVNFELFEYAV